jgi:hypothetical protein
MLTDLVALLVYWPRARVDCNHGGKRLQESGRLEQEERDLRHLFLQLIKWQLLNNRVFRLQLCCNCGGDEVINSKLLELLTLVRHPMAQMRGQDIEKVRQKVDAEEDLSRFVKTPIEELDERHQPVGLEHVVAVLAQAAELLDYFDYQSKRFAQVLQLLAGTHRDAFTHVN